MTTRGHGVLLVFVIVGLIMAACAAPSSGGKVAIVNGTPISQADYDKQVKMVQDSMIEQGLDPKSADGKASLDQMRVDILNQLIDVELMRQAAKSEGITVSDADVNQRMEQIKKDAGGQDAFNKSLRDAKITEQDFRNLIVRDQMIYERLYDKITKALPTTAEQVRSRHILLNTEKEANDVKARLGKGEDFAALAKELSQDTQTKDNGGDLGFYPRGVLDPAFENLIFQLKVNEIGIVQTDFGYHIVQVTAHETDRPLSPEVLQMLGEQMVNRYLDDVRSKAQIERLLVLPPTATPSQ